MDNSADKNSLNLGVLRRQEQQFAAGDLVRFAFKPLRQPSDSPHLQDPLSGHPRDQIWTPCHEDLQGAQLGIVIEERDMGGHGILLGQCVLVKLDTGRLVTISSRLLERVEPQA